MARVLCFVLVLSGAAAFPTERSAAQPLHAVYRHPSGFTFAHPSSWREQPLNDSVLALIPADVQMHQGQPAEIVLVAGEDAPGVSDPLDKKVVTLADQFVNAVLPFVQRNGDATRIEVAGTSAAELRYSGTSPTGLDARATLWVRLLNGSAVALLVAGPLDAFDARAASAKTVFDSFDYEPPKRDTRLVGTWRHSRTYMSGEFSMIERQTLTLQADGSFREDSQLMGGLQSSDDSGMHTGDANASSENASAGHWRTANKQITLEWSGGATEEWEYLISGNDLMFRSGSSKKLWARVN